MQALTEYGANTRVGTQAAMAEAVRGLDDAAFGRLCLLPGARPALKDGHAIGKGPRGLSMGVYPALQLT